MKVQRGLPGKVEPTLYALRIPAGKCAVVVPFPDTSLWVSLPLHYDTKAQARVPCPGEECRCQGTGKGWSIEQRTYAPIFLYKPNGSYSDGSPMLPARFHWTVGIFGFTLGILNTCIDNIGKPLLLSRGEGRKNAPLRLRPIAIDNPIPDFPREIDLVNTLSRVYGVKME